MYDETMAKMHFWMSFVGVNLTFFPQHFSGLAGMPRRIPDYALQFADFNMLSSVGAYVFGFSQLIFLYVVITTIRGGRSAIGVWAGAHGLEWAVPTPAPSRSSPGPDGRR